MDVEWWSTMTNLYQINDRVMYNGMDFIVREVLEQDNSIQYRIEKFSYYQFITTVNEYQLSEFNYANTTA